MSISYEPLWKMLDELNVSKMEFARKIDISNATLSKFSKNEPVTLTVVDKICEEFNCDVSNIVTHVVSQNKEPIARENLVSGIIVTSSCYPLGTSVRTKVTNFPPNNCQCVILKTYAPNDTENKKSHFLIAPINYKSEPNTILDIPFKGLEINDSNVNGYVQIGKMGIAQFSSLESVIGKMPKYFMDSLNLLLDDLKPILVKHEIATTILMDKFI